MTSQLLHVALFSSMILALALLVGLASKGEAQDGDATPAAQPLAATDQAWTPEAMEALLAPIALYADPVLTQVLIAATNPQEVLDAGNWLIANPELEGDALFEAAKEAGFTEPMRAVMPFRQIVDQICLEMGWTTELGQAYTNDEAGVLAAVQRLRARATGGPRAVSRRLTTAISIACCTRRETARPAVPRSTFWTGEW